MSTPDQLLRDLARARQHHLESLGGREAALVGELEGELVLIGRRSGRHLEDLHHGSILPSSRPSISKGLHDADGHARAGPYVGVKAHESYDGEPATEGAGKNDWG